MSYDEILRIVGNVLVLSLLAPLVLFIVRYAKYSPWRVNAIGRNVMYQKMAISGVLLILLIGTFIPDFFLRQEFRVLGFSAVAWSYWYDVITLIKTQHKYPLDRPKPFVWVDRFKRR